MKKKFVSLALAACAVTLALPAAAQSIFSKPDDAIKYRQAAFFVMAKHFAHLGAMADNKIPYDAKAAATDADVIAAVYKLPHTGFLPGTEKGANTEAKPEVWRQQAKFNDGFDKMYAQMDKLIPAAKSGNQADLKAAFGPTGRTCKGCHDDFRKE